MQKTTCVSMRKILVDYKKQPHDVGLLDLALNGCIEIEAGVFGNAAAEAAAKHISECDACVEWLDTLLPPEVLVARQTRQVRLAKYCCIRMFFATNDEDAKRRTGSVETTRFTFERFRGEDPCWCINGDYAFANFCPWCGTALPSRAFE
jgi:hypothetical protein